MEKTTNTVIITESDLDDRKQVLIKVDGMTAHIVWEDFGIDIAAWFNQETFPNPKISHRIYQYGRVTKILDKTVRKHRELIEADRVYREIKEILTKEIKALRKELDDVVSEEKENGNKTVF